MKVMFDNAHASNLVATDGPISSVAKLQVKDLRPSEKEPNFT